MSPPPAPVVPTYTPVVPWLLVPDGQGQPGRFTSLGAADRIAGVPLTVQAACTISGVRIQIGNPAGNIQVGIADNASGAAGGNVLASSAVIACPAAAARVDVNFSVAQALTPGRYWLLLFASSNAATFGLTHDSTVTGSMIGKFQTRAGGFGATFAAAGETSNVPVIFGRIGNYP